MSPWAHAWGSLGLLGTAIVASGCPQQPLPCLIELETGDLVVTEIRGPQDGTRGEWFELYNASGAQVDLLGLRGTLEPLKGSEVDGAAALSFLVRESLTVEAGAYVVLGTLPLDEARRPGLDYSVNDDFRSEPPIVEVSGGVVELPEDENSDPRNLFANARLRFLSCDRVIDTLVYTELPPLGTFSYDGAGTPDADDNDDLRRWCADETEAPAGGPQTATGLPGTPGEANLPCG